MKQFVRNQGGQQQDWAMDVRRRHEKVVQAALVVHKAHEPVATATQAVKDAERALANAKDEESKAKTEAALAAAKATLESAQKPWEEAKKVCATEVNQDKGLVEDREARNFLESLRTLATRVVTIRGTRIQALHPGVMDAISNSVGSYIPLEETVVETGEEESRKVVGPFFPLRWEARNSSKMVRAALKCAEILGTNFAKGFKRGLEYLVMTALPAAMDKELAGYEAAQAAGKDYDTGRLETLETFRVAFLGEMGKGDRKGRPGLVPSSWLSDWKESAKKRQATKQGEGASSTSATKPAAKADAPKRAVRVGSHGGVFYGTEEEIAELGLETDGATIDTPPATDEAVEGAKDAQC